MPAPGQPVEPIRSAETGPADGDSDALVRRLGALDVCAVSDALDALGLAGSVLGLLPMWEGARTVGRAVTVELAEGPRPDDHPAVHLGSRAIESARAGDVIVVANAGRVEMGGWGGLLSLACSVRGVAGVVVDGAFRDADEARESRFPAFARAAVQRTARSRVHEVATGSPVSVAGVRVANGDIVMADGSGVVFLAASRAEEIVRRAEQIDLRERAMKQALLAGDPVSQVLGRSYEDMLLGEPAAEVSRSRGRGRPKTMEERKKR